MNGLASSGDPGISRSRYGRRLVFLAICALAASALMAPAASAAGDKVLVCHASGQADTTKFETLSVPPNEGGFPQGHFTEGGTAAAGHESDYLGACNEDPPPPPDDPKIKVVKSADPTSLGSGGGSVTYTYVVTNDGDVALTDVTIEDDKCADITGPISDTNDDELLDVDETWTYECTMDVTASITNTVVVEGTSGEDTVSGTDTFSVTVGQELPATGTPKPSLPSTSTIDEPGQGGGGAALVLVLLLLAAGAVGLVILDPASIRIRK